MVLKYTKWLWYFPIGHRIYQLFSFKGPPKFTQIWIFGSKTNHLANLSPTYLTQLLRPATRPSSKVLGVLLFQPKCIWFSWTKETVIYDANLHKEISGRDDILRGHVRGQCCQIFLPTKYQNGEKLPNDHKIYQMAINFFHWL
jgi:hypothetical protein